MGPIWEIASHATLPTTPLDAAKVPCYVHFVKHGPQDSEEQLSFNGILPESDPSLLVKEIGAPPFEFSARLLTTEQELANFVDQALTAKKPLYLDVKSSEASFVHGTVFAVVLLTTEEAAYVPLAHKKGPNIEPAVAQQHLGRLLNSDLRKVIHDATFHLPPLTMAGFQVSSPISDTRLIGRELHMRRPEYYNLKALSAQHIHPRAEYWDLQLLLTLRAKVGTQNLRDLWQLSAEEIFHAASADAALTQKLHKHFGAQITDKKSVHYLQNESALIPVIVDITTNGMDVDIEKLEKHLGRFNEELKVIDLELDRLIGAKGVNYNSAKQVLPVLARMGLTAVNPRNGKPSICLEALERLPQDLPVVSKLLERKKIENQLVQIAPLKDSIGSDHRVHTHITISAQQGERFSSVNPSLYTGKKEPEPGELTLREFIIPGKDHLFGFFDFSSSHFRILAHLCEDENMAKLFREGKDFHTNTAAQLYGKPYDKITKEERARIKPLGFGIIYGMGDAGVARNLKLSLEEARVMKNDFLFKVYPKLGPYIIKTNRFVKDQGYIYSGLYGVKLAVNQEYAFNGLNYQIQATEAEMMKNTLITLAGFLKDRRSRIALPFHDEIIVCIHQSEESLIPDIRGIVENRGLRVPMKSDFKISRNTWGSHDPAS